MGFHDRRALYVSWVYIHDEIQDGVVAYLFFGLETTVNNPRVRSENDVGMIPVYPPSMLPKGEEATWFLLRPHPTILLPQYQQFQT